MSIITDALRKAENERELKAKQASDDTAEVIAVTEEEEALVASANSAFPAKVPSFQNLKPEIPIAVGVKELLNQNQPAWKYSTFLMVCAFFLVCLFVFLLSRKPVVILQSNMGSVRGQANKPAVFNFLKTQTVQLPYVLSGISSAGNNHYAIVNGMIVQQGDSIDGAHVKEILEQEIILETRAGEIKLNLKS